MSSSGMIPPPKTAMSEASRSAEEVDERAEERHVRPGEDRQPDQVGVLLDRGLHDLLGRLVEAGVDDLVPGVAERAGDDLGATVVTVEAALADHDAQPAGAGGAVEVMSAGYRVGEGAPGGDHRHPAHGCYT